VWDQEDQGSRVGIDPTRPSRGTEATRHKIYIVDFGRAENYLTEEANHRAPKKESRRYDVGWGLYRFWRKENFTASRRRSRRHYEFGFCLDETKSPAVNHGHGQE
jgi:hypothetical protein